jgi:TolB-like protein
LPFRTEKGDTLEASDELAEDLTTQLARQEITVLERSVLDKVVLEQALQNIVLFEPEKVQKLGQLSGASVIVTGKIVMKDKSATAYARLIDVRTGKILYAASSPMTLTNTKVVGKSNDSKPADKKKDSKPLPKGAYRSTAIELTEKTPATWILKEAKRGLQVWSDKAYVWTALPKEIVGGTVLWRPTGQAGWVQPGAVTALKDCKCYALVQWKYMDRIEIDEITFAQFAKDGWEEVDGDLKMNFPGGEDWRWKALRKEVPEGDVILQLDHVNFGDRRTVIFVFK